VVFFAVVKLVVNFLDGVPWISIITIFENTLWLFNIAMGNGPFIEVYLLIAW
jgi:hypothetical protein